MKTITIQELHERTQDYVRAAEREPIAIADQGRQVAVLSSLRGADLSGKPFPRRDVDSLPKVVVETSDYITEDRNGADERQGPWTFFSVTAPLIDEACATVERLSGGVYIRSADALHLTCAKEQGFPDIYSNDRHLLTAAPHFGLVGRNVIS